MATILLFSALVLLLVAGSILFSVVRGYIPAIPSSKAVRVTILNQIQELNLPAACIAEIGCGYGFILFALARQFPKAEIIGFEIALVPYLFCRLIQKMGRFQNVSFIYGDAFKQIKQQNRCFDIVFAYLINTSSIIRAMEEIHQNHVRHCLIMNTYPLNHPKPTRVIGPLGWFKSFLYLYRKK